MTISGITTSTLVAAYRPPSEQQQGTPKSKGGAADTVSISAKAQQLASDGDTGLEESAETTDMKGNELMRGLL